IQWGMEYNPIAINEVLAYQFTCNQGGTAVEAQRLFVELVNTLTQNEGSGGTACDLGLPGWGFLITQDNPNAASTTPPNAKFERPNTVTGQLDPNTIQTYWQPLNGSRTTPQALATAIKAMSRQGPGNRDYGGNDRRFFVMGSTVPPPSASTDLGTQIATQGTLPNELVQQIPKYSPGSGNADFFWLHLVRPANPLDPNSTKVVVDSMRFPYIDGGGRVGSGTPPPNVIYSVGRLQPYRGGQLVPGCQNFTPPYPYGFSDQVDTQTSDSASQSNLQGAYNGTAITNKIFHTLGGKRGANPNDSDSNEQNENWDYFPFFDRDFTSVAELLLVPGCPPGLFTKLFVERVSPPIPSGLPTTYQPPLVTGSGATPSIRWYTGGPSVGSIPDPGVFPYLVDAFYYSTPQNTAPTPLPPGFSNRVGWHKILEFFEVPSSVLGATGPADQGNNGDWFRQDTRPGLINLNLIIDEEVFFGLIDDPRLNSTYAFANLAAASAANLPPGGSTPYGVPGVPRVATAIYPASSPTPFAPSATYPISDLTKYPQGRGYFDGANNFMKSAFSDFLKLRHGGSGLVFSPVSAASAIWGPGPTFVSWPEKPFHSLAAPDINDTIMRPARLAAISGDQGVRQPTLQIPPRRLFQIPDAMPTGGSPPNDPAAETGSQYVAADGTTTSTLGNDHVFLSSVNPTGTTPPGPPGWNASLISPVYDSTGIILPPILPADPSLLGGATGGSDRRRHPYFRTELLQKVMNLSTVRTHQYAVWVTVGFFEVVEPGNPQLASLNPTAAIDQLGKEVGADAGTSVRYRAFFIVDRTKAHGFNPADPDDFRDCVVFRRRIE
ncbi:MAG: hypothetical protein IRY99_19495, partial [Isosphaeraceae bacterium]|nr:hypothetical protein [Isosphaeraceae bacterium]